ncbi:MAG: hypothetical protein FWD27_02225 [Coriobacteriia bacterium]|nr:hypothetical protein [Coriobacteriia bacterium]
MKKSIKTLIASMVAVALTFGFMGTAIAQPNTDAAETSEAAITKLLKVPYGTALPAQMDFEFTVTAISYNDSTADVGKVPVIGTVPISFDGIQELEGTVGGVTTYYLESDSLFTVSMFATNGAGVYEYEIRETPDTYTPPSNSDYIEVVEYSGAIWTVKVYVDEIDGVLEITHIGAVMTQDHEGEEVDEGDQSKSDPSPGGGDSTFEYSQLIFANGYQKTLKPTDPGNPDPLDENDWTLFVSKEVTGDFSSTDMEFNFSLTINIPSLVVNDVKSSYGYIVQKDGSDYTAVGSAILFNSGAAVNFTLAHNQYLVFVDTPVGTGFAVGEAGVAGYTPSVTVIYDFAAAVPTTGEASSAKGQPLAVPHGNISPTLLFVGEHGSGAAFVNDRGEIIPTGINTADLPFYGLILLALASIIGFVVVKSRKSKSESNN